MPRWIWLSGRERRLRRPRPRTERRFLELLEGRTLLAGVIAVGTDAGPAAEVKLFTDTDGNGSYETDSTGGVFRPFGAFAGGARVAIGNVDGVGRPELIVAAGPGGGPQIAIYDLTASGGVGALRETFFAFDPGFTGGTQVALGDLNADGRAELIVGAGAGGGPQVAIFSDVTGDGRLAGERTDVFFAFDPGFTGGVTVAAGVLNPRANFGAQVIVGAGPGGGPSVAVFTDASRNRRVSDEAVVESFFAFDPGFTGGVYVASSIVSDFGSPTGNADAEIVVGAGPGGGPSVHVFSDRDFDGLVGDDAPFEAFFAYEPSFAGGVRVASANVDGRNRTGSNRAGPAAFSEVVTAPGPGGGGRVRYFGDGFDALAFIADEPPIDDFLAFGGFAGSFVAAGQF